MPLPARPHDFLSGSRPDPDMPRTDAVPEASVSKRFLRKTILTQRTALASSEAAQLSTVIQQRMLNESCWQKARIVALYVAARNEVSTETLLDAAWNTGKLVLLPRCLPPEQGEGLMEFALCRGRDELTPGAFGLLEPGPQCPVWTDTRLIDDGMTVRYPELMLVPAVGISPSGARIGYGKGYYDRLLAQPCWRAVPRVALVYDFQIVSFPASPLDVPMNAYLTEKESRWL